MCVSATVSFGMGGALLAGGALALRKSFMGDRRYFPMAAFPAMVGIQQWAEGFVWLGLEGGNPGLAVAASYFFLFFTWMVWPVWIPFLIFAVETDEKKKRLLGVFMVAGLFLGAILFLPYFFHPDWLHPETARHAIVYNTKLLPDAYIPRQITYMVYLAIIGFAPLLSSYARLNVFGLALLTAVPVTRLLFVEAHISVLCFLAAVISFYLLNIIWRNLCAKPPSTLKTA